MSDAAWKAEERRVARMLGTTRRLMKGTHEVEDLTHDIYSVDVKLRSRLRVQAWWEKLCEDAEAKGKTPILVFRRPRVSRLRLAAVDHDFGMRIYRHFPNVFMLEEREGSAWSVENWFRDLKKKCDRKIPVLSIKHTQKPYSLVVFDFDNLVSALKGIESARDWARLSAEDTAGMNSHNEVELAVIER